MIVTVAYDQKVPDREDTDDEKSSVTDEQNTNVFYFYRGNGHRKIAVRPGQGVFY